VDKASGKSQEQKMVYIFEPKYGENLSEEEERSTEDLIYFQEGNKKGSVEDLKECQETRKKNSSFQVGKEEMRLSESLRNSEKSSDQQGVLTEKEEEMRLSESLKNSEESLDQQGFLTGEEKDQRCIMIIGRIIIFHPRSPKEANACVVHEEVM
jgi:hypothetical protein